MLVFVVGHGADSRRLFDHDHLRIEVQDGALGQGRLPRGARRVGTQLELRPRRDRLSGIEQRDSVDEDLAGAHEPPHLVPALANE